MLALFLMVSLVSCAKEELKKTTQENQANTEELSDEEKAAANEKAAEDFIRDYREGKYADKTTFQYEDFSAYYELGEYRNLLYPEDALIEESVSDERVEEYLNILLIAAKVSDEKYTDLTEGVVQKYDMVTIDYRGIIDGVEAEKATANDQELMIGSGKYISGFEAGLIGKEIGKEVRLDLNFSPYYSSKDVAGKSVTFYVTVKKVQRPEIPEMTVDVVNEIFSTTFATVEEARAELKKDLESEQKSLAYSYVTTYLQNKVMENSRVIEYPE
jgi:trigger factor